MSYMRVSTPTAAILSALLGLCGALRVHAPLAAERPAIENQQVAKALTEAKGLTEKKQWDAALAAVRRAQQVSVKSPYAQYKIDEFIGYILAQQRKYGEAASVFERLSRSNQTPRDELDRHLRTAAQLYFEAKQYSQAAELASRALQLRRGDVPLLELSGQARYLANDFKGAAKTLQQLVVATERRGGTPQEEWLQIILNSYYKLNDRDGVAATWEALLHHYPKQQYWEAVLDLKTANVRSEPLEFGYQRLMFDLGILEEDADYEELAMRAIEVGMPGEAVRVLQAGLDNGTLSGSNQAHFRRMLRYAEEQVAKQQAALGALAESAQTAATGQRSVALGRAYLGYARYDAAITALQHGIQKGSLDSPDQARIDLGIAYLNSNQTGQAKKTFAAVVTDSEWRDLAKLWSLRATSRTAS